MKAAMLDNKKRTEFPSVRLQNTFQTWRWKGITELRQFTSCPMPSILIGTKQLFWSLVCSLSNNVQKLNCRIIKRNAIYGFQTVIKHDASPQVSVVRGIPPPQWKNEVKNWSWKCNGNIYVKLKQHCSINFCGLVLSSN